MGKQLTDNQTQTANLLTNSINAVGNQLAEGQAQLAERQNQIGNIVTNVGNQIANTQLSRDQLYQELYQHNITGIQNLMDAIYHGYANLMNHPQQSVIYLNDRQHEVVNTQRFTPQAMEQVNRAAALIDAYENRDPNSTNEGWESDDTREDFIAFSSLLARNFNNTVFRQFANNLGFSRLFRAYRDRNDERRPHLMNFFIRLANCKDLIQDYLDYMKDKIKRNAVVIDQSFEQYLQNTYNTIKDMFIVECFNG